jgi:CheY-like chemotaxis protein
VLAAVDVLSDEQLADEIQPLVEVVRRNVELEARLIDDLLDLTRIIKGKLRLASEVLDVHALLENVLDICRVDIAGKDLILAIDFGAERRHVEGDPARLQQVFWNILKNAIKFTPSGGTITISTRNDGDAIEVDVTDTGIGIEPGMTEIIFNAFEQGEQAMTRRFGGLGLGLAIGKSLVEMHNGTIAARSQGKDHGSVFSVSLPLTSPVETVTPETPEGIPAPLAREEIRILLVDDHTDTVSVMRLLLRRRGFQVYTAYSVDSAVKVAAEYPFDLVISDIGLPDGSGLDLFERLRSNGPLKAIAMSGFGTSQDVALSIRSGFSVHLVKPISARVLHEAIDRLLS